MSGSDPGGVTALNSIAPAHPGRERYGLLSPDIAELNSAARSKEKAEYLSLLDKLLSILQVRQPESKERPLE